ncbi:MAG: hypothetical protein NTX86_04885 [Candidatus Dependentiae bacterium]|nr:hypothetical protein [Candidatus Dependentiae bacterium]
MKNKHILVLIVALVSSNLQGMWSSRFTTMLAGARTALAARMPAFKPQMPTFSGSGFFSRFAMGSNGLGAGMGNIASKFSFKPTVSRLALGSAFFATAAATATPQKAYAQGNNTLELSTENIDKYPHYKHLFIECAKKNLAMPYVLEAFNKAGQIESIVHLINKYPDAASELALEATKQGENIPAQIQQALVKQVPGFTMNLRPSIIDGGQLVGVGLNTALVQSLNVACKFAPAMFDAMDKDDTHHLDILDAQLRKEAVSATIKSLPYDITANLVSNVIKRQILDCSPYVKVPLRVAVDATVSVANEYIKSGQSMNELPGFVIKEAPRAVTTALATNGAQSLVNRYIQCPAYKQDGGNKRYYACGTGKWVLNNFIVPTLVRQALYGSDESAPAGSDKPSTPEQ